AVGLSAEGARVHVCDVSSEALAALSAACPGLLGTRADVGSEADVDRLFADVSAHLGGLDVLVNNAGIAGPTAAVDEILPADWQRTLDVNLTGPFLCARRSVPLLEQAVGSGVL